MKTKLPIMIGSAIILAYSFSAQAQSPSVTAATQDQFNILSAQSLWTATASSDGSGFTLTEGQTSADGGFAFLNGPNVDNPIGIWQGSGTLTFMDEEPTFHPGIIPQATATINSTTPISELVFALNSPQYSQYPALLDNISIVINGATNNIANVLDTTSSQFQGIDIKLGQSTDVFSIQFGFNPDGFNTYSQSTFTVLAIPEPSPLALTGMGFALFGLITFG